MEIERKWLVSGWPDEKLPLLEEHLMRQGYLTVEPTVRIREETLKRRAGKDLKDGTCAGGDACRTDYVLCIKTGRGIAREEIELDIPEDKFREIERVIGLPLIPKVRRTYALPHGLRLEVNHVDEGRPEEFWYAEIEYPTKEAARSYDPASSGLQEYLKRDVTDEPGQTMGAYWLITRVRKK